MESYNIRVHFYEKTKNRKNPVYYVCIGCKKDIIQVLDNIYKDADTFMNRKYNLARSISNNV